MKGLSKKMKGDGGDKGETVILLLNLEEDPKIESYKAC